MDYPEFPDSVCQFLRKQADCDDSKVPVVIEDGQHEPTLRGVYKNKVHRGTVRVSVGCGYVTDKRSLLTARVGRFYDHWIKRSRRRLLDRGCYALQYSQALKNIHSKSADAIMVLEGWIDFLPNEPMFVYLRDEVFHLLVEATLLLAAQGRS